MICFRNCHFIALAVLLFSVASLGACYSSYNTVYLSDYISYSCIACNGYNTQYQTCSWYNGCGGGADLWSNYCKGSLCVCTKYNSSCPRVAKYSSSAYLTNYQGLWGSDDGCTMKSNLRCRYSMYCDSQFEADSVDCVNRGDVWQNGTCKPP